MQIRSIALTSIALFSSATIMADNIQLRNIRVPKTVKGQVADPLPFTADVTFEHLTLHFKSSNSLYIVIKGSEGIVLTKEVQVQTNQTIIYDLSNYRDGLYQIYIIDAKGNDVSGEFLKQVNGSTEDIDESD